MGFFFGGGGVFTRFILICGKNLIANSYVCIVKSFALLFNCTKVNETFPALHIFVLLFSECFFRPVKDSPNKYWNERANQEQDCPPSLVYRPDICVCGNPLKSDTERKAIAAPTISTLKFTMFEILYLKCSFPDFKKKNNQLILFVFMFWLIYKKIERIFFLHKKT